MSIPPADKPVQPKNLEGNLPALSRSALANIHAELQSPIRKATVPAVGDTRNDKRVKSAPEKQAKGVKKVDETEKGKPKPESAATHVDLHDPYSDGAALSATAVMRQGAQAAPEIQRQVAPVAGKQTELARKQDPDETQKPLQTKDLTKKPVAKGDATPLTVADVQSARALESSKKASVKVLGDLSTQTTLGDGTKVTKKHDGTLVKEGTDGSIQTIKPDRTSSMQYKDGLRVTFDKDGVPLRATDKSGKSLKLDPKNQESVKGDTPSFSFTNDKGDKTTVSLNDGARKTDLHSGAVRLDNSQGQPVELHSSDGNLVYKGVQYDKHGNVSQLTDSQGTWTRTSTSEKHGNLPSPQDKWAKSPTSPGEKGEAGIPSSSTSNSWTGSIRINKTNGDMTVRAAGAHTETTVHSDATVTRTDKPRPAPMETPAARPAGQDQIVKNEKGQIVQTGAGDNQRTYGYDSSGRMNQVKEGNYTWNRVGSTDVWRGAAKDGTSPQTVSGMKLLPHTGVLQFKNGNQTEMHYPSGARTISSGTDGSTLRVNPSDRIDNVKTRGGKNYQYTYDAKGGLQSASLPDGTKLSRQAATTAGGAPMFRDQNGHEYKNVQLDRNGNLSYQNSAGQMVSHLASGRDFVQSPGSGKLLPVSDSGRGSVRPTSGRSGEAVPPPVAKPAPIVQPGNDRLAASGFRGNTLKGPGAPSAPEIAKGRQPAVEGAPRTAARVAPPADAVVARAPAKPVPTVNARPIEAQKGAPARLADPKEAAVRPVVSKPDIAPTVKPAPARIAQAPQVREPAPVRPVPGRQVADAAAAAARLKEPAPIRPVLSRPVTDAAVAAAKLRDAGADRTARLSSAVSRLKNVVGDLGGTANGAAARVHALPGAGPVRDANGKLVTPPPHKSVVASNEQTIKPVPTHVLGGVVNANFNLKEVKVGSVNSALVQPRPVPGQERVAGAVAARGELLRTAALLTPGQRLPGVRQIASPPSLTGGPVDSARAGLLGQRPLSGDPRAVTISTDRQLHPLPSTRLEQAKLTTSGSSSPFTLAGLRQPLDTLPSPNRLGVQQTAQMLPGEMRTADTRTFLAKTALPSINGHQNLQVGYSLHGSISRELTSPRAVPTLKADQSAAVLALQSATRAAATMKGLLQSTTRQAFRTLDPSDLAKLRAMLATLKTAGARSGGTRSSSSSASGGRSSSTPVGNATIGRNLGGGGSSKGGKSTRHDQNAVRVSTANNPINRLHVPQDPKQSGAAAKSTNANNPANSNQNQNSTNPQNSVSVSTCMVHQPSSLAALKGVLEHNISVDLNLMRHLESALLSSRSWPPHFAQKMASELCWLAMMFRHDARELSRILGGHGSDHHHLGKGGHDDAPAGARHSCVRPGETELIPQTLQGITADPLLQDILGLFQGPVSNGFSGITLAISQLIGNQFNNQPLSQPLAQSNCQQFVQPLFQPYNLSVVSNSSTWIGNCGWQGAVSPNGNCDFSASDPCSNVLVSSNAVTPWWGHLNPFGSLNASPNSILAGDPTDAAAVLSDTTSDLLQIHRQNDAEVSRAGDTKPHLTPDEVRNIERAAEKAGHAAAKAESMLHHHNHHQAQQEAHKQQEQQKQQDLQQKHDQHQKYLDQHRQWLQEQKRLQDERDEHQKQQKQKEEQERQHQREQQRLQQQREEQKRKQQQEEQRRQDQLNEDNFQMRHVVKSNETLPSIADARLGSKMLWILIFELNKRRIPVKMVQGKQIQVLIPGTVLLLPSKKQVREWRRANLSRYAQTAQSDIPTMAPSEEDKTANANRRANVEKLLGPIAQAPQAPSYVVRLGDTLRSIAIRHPALSDLKLWKLLAQKNNLPLTCDAKGMPTAALQRGSKLLLPTSEEIGAFLADFYSSKPNRVNTVGASSTTTVFELVSKECPNCQRLVTQSNSVCPACAYSFVSTTVEGMDSESTVLTDSISAEVQTNSLLDEQDDQRTVIRSAAEPESIDEDKTLIAGANDDLLLTTRSLGGDVTAVEKNNLPIVEKVLERSIEQYSENCRLVRTVVERFGSRISRSQLEAKKNDRWALVLVYELSETASMRQETLPSGGIWTLNIDLPLPLAQEMVQNDLSSNWKIYYKKFIAGKRLSA